jgi:hypothetical protein
MTSMSEHPEGDADKDQGQTDDLGDIQSADTHALITADEFQ